MAFSSQKLPNEDLSIAKLNDELRNVLMKHWEEGYKDGVESCATMLEVIANSLVEQGNKELAQLLDNLGQNFREQVKQCVG